jgi:hypothetical protein
MSIVYLFIYLFTYLFVYLFIYSLQAVIARRSEWISTHNFLKDPKELLQTYLMLQEILRLRVIKCKTQKL